MADRPPETALDRLRAGLHRRNDPPPADAPAPESTPAPSAAAPPPLDPAPANEPAGGSGQAPPIRQAPPARRQAVSADRADLLQEIARRRERSRTRRRINLTWTVAVALTAGVIAAASYLYAANMQDNWFRRLWPWRHHVWSQQGGAVLWCMNEARKRDGRIDCTITVGEHGPDCPDIRDPDSIAIGTMFRCKPWDGGWPTDPAPRWGADGPPHWSR